MKFQNGCIMYAKMYRGSLFEAGEQLTLVNVDITGVKGK